MRCIELPRAIGPPREIDQGEMHLLKRPVAAARQIFARARLRFAVIHEIGRGEGWRVALAALAEWAVRSLRHRLAGAVMPAGRRTQPPMPPEDVLNPVERNAAPRMAVLFAGYVEASLGLGESLRNMIEATTATEIPFAIYPYNFGVENRSVRRFLPERYDRDRIYAVNIVEISADQIPNFLAKFGVDRRRNSHNILRTYWELPTAPLEWKPNLDAFDEIWAPNEFVANAFRPIFSRRISIVPPCVIVGSFAEFDHKHFSLDTSTYYFIFTFDYYSYPARKNPLGVLRAFRAAFPDLTRKVGLIIKSTDSFGEYPDIKLALRQAAAHDKRIRIIDRTLSRDELLSLIGCSDCYVSLHRSEGFGLGMVEAMALGKPVIGTDFSGSTDFLSTETGFPVPYSVRNLRHGEYIFGEGQHWAEPDLDAAAAAMRTVVESSEVAAERAAAGQAFVAKRYGIGNVGHVVAGRIEDIMRERQRSAASVSES